MAQKGKDKARSRDRGNDPNRDFESAKIHQTIRHREHMAYPLPNGDRLIPLDTAEEITRHLRPALRDRVLHPPVKEVGAA